MKLELFPVCSSAGDDCTQREGHSPYQGREEHPGGSEASLHRRPHLCLPDWREAVPHLGVPERLVHQYHQTQANM